MQLSLLFVHETGKWCSIDTWIVCHVTLIQDSLARAVADEMQKVYKDELGPEPVPLTVEGEVVDEEDVSPLLTSSFPFSFSMRWQYALF